MKKWKWFVPMIAIWIGLGVATSSFAAEGKGTKFDKKKFITSEQLKLGPPVMLRVRGVGTFEIVEIRPGDRRGEQCAVEIASLQKEVQNLNRRGKLTLEIGQTSAISLAKTECSSPHGPLVCCKGSGSDCTIAGVYQGN